jgi:hypothetical protein
MMSKINIDNRLCQSFSGNEVTIVAQDLYIGFRPDADRFILLVEVTMPKNLGPGVVKLRLPGDIRDHCASPSSCKAVWGGIGGRMPTMS